MGADLHRNRVLCETCSSGRDCWLLPCKAELWRRRQLCSAGINEDLTCVRKVLMAMQGWQACRAQQSTSKSFLSGD